jgi:hypothetical protein
LSVDGFLQSLFYISLNLHWRTASVILAPSKDTFVYNRQPTTVNLEIKETTP